MPPYVVISDIHLFNRRTPTLHIIDAFWQWWAEHTEMLKQCKYFIIAGDITDRSISSHYPDITLVNKFFITLGTRLRDNNITLIVLEGTAVHDRKQFSSLLPLLTALNVNVHYYTTVCVEVFEDISMLFIPDNWSTDPAVTLQDAENAVKAAGLSQVDIGVVHGHVEYQLPMMKQSALSQKGLEALVKHRIHIGHVHIPSHKGKVDAQGSFDRISHGEEHDKGGNLFINNKRIRLVNRRAYPYVTLPIETLDPILMDQQVQQAVMQMGQLGWLRIHATRHHPVYDRFPTYTQQYRSVKFERKYTNIKEETIVSPIPSVTHLSTSAVLEAIVVKYPTVSPPVLTLIQEQLNLCE